MKDYAVIEIGGKQYAVNAGTKLTVDKVKEKENGKTLKVLLTNINGKLTIGTPYITGHKIKYNIVKQFKGPKVRVAKFRAKSRYRKTVGHRQHLTQIEILSI